MDVNTENVDANLSSVTGLVFNKTGNTPVEDFTKGLDSSINILRLLSDKNIPVKIKLDEISVPDAKGSDTNVVENGGQKVECGVTYPMIRINDVVLSKKNIVGMSLYQTGVIPTISLSLTFAETTFVNKNMPKDGDMISIYLRTDTNALKYIRNDYIITSCSSSVKKNGDCSATLSGELFIPGFNSLQNCIGIIGTSKSVMKQVAKKFGIGFQYNDTDDTNDYQNWIGCNESMTSFLSSVIRHSWKNNSSFFRFWINPYYELAFINVNKFLLTSENKEDIDITAFSDALNLGKTQIGKNQSTNEVKLMPKCLTNSSDFKGSSMHIRSWHPVNNSTMISMTSGYENISYTFIHNQNLINVAKDNCFSELRNIPAYDKNKTNTYMILRGRNRYDASANPESEMMRQNYNFVNTYIRKNWCGVEYTMADNDNGRDSAYWSGNVHKNYTRAVEHNSINISELDKMYIEVVVDGLCLQIMRGERIPVFITYEGVNERDSNNTTKTDKKRDANRLYTGYYIVDSMEFTFNPKSTTSPFSTRMKLCRREWPTPEAI